MFLEQPLPSPAFPSGESRCLVWGKTLPQGPWMIIQKLYKYVENLIGGMSKALKRTFIISPSSIRQMWGYEKQINSVHFILFGRKCVSSKICSLPKEYLFPFHCVPFLSWTSSTDCLPTTLELLPHDPACFLRSRPLSQMCERPTILPLKVL